MPSTALASTAVSFIFSHHRDSGDVRGTPEMSDPNQDFLSVEPITPVLNDASSWNTECMAICQGGRCTNPIANEDGVLLLAPKRDPRFYETAFDFEPLAQAMLCTVHADHAYRVAEAWSVESKRSELLDWLGLPSNPTRWNCLRGGCPLTRTCRYEAHDTINRLLGDFTHMDAAAIRVQIRRDIQTLVRFLVCSSHAADKLGLWINCFVDPLAEHLADLLENRSKGQISHLPWPDQAFRRRPKDNSLHLTNSNAEDQRPPQTPVIRIASDGSCSDTEDNQGSFKDDSGEETRSEFSTTSPSTESSPSEQRIRRRRGASEKQNNGQTRGIKKPRLTASEYEDTSSTSNENLPNATSLAGSPDGRANNSAREHRRRSDQPDLQATFAARDADQETRLSPPAGRSRQRRPQSASFPMGGSAEDASGSTPNDNQSADYLRPRTPDSSAARPSTHLSQSEPIVRHTRIGITASRQARSVTAPGSPSGAPGDNFEREHQEQWASKPNVMDGSLLRELEKPLSKASKDSIGQVYVFRSKECPNYVKIGFATKGSEVRAKYLKSQHRGLHTFEPVYVGPRRRYHFYKRVEALVQLELHDQRRRLTCHCDATREPFQPNGFTEWFEVAPDKASAIVQRWSSWVIPHHNGEHAWLSALLHPSIYNSEGCLRYFYWKRQLQHAEKSPYTEAGLVTPAHVRDWEEWMERPSLRELLAEFAFGERGDRRSRWAEAVAHRWMLLGSLIISTLYSTASMPADRLLYPLLLVIAGEFIC